MCVLCGELIMNVHWTDQPFHDAEYGQRERVVAGEGQRDRRRMRLRRVAVADRVLRYYGLSIRDWNGSKYVLADRKGNSRIVSDLGDMWNTAAQMCRRTLDPLDPDFLCAIRGGV